MVTYTAMRQMSDAPSNTNAPEAVRRLAIFVPVLNGGGAERMMRYLGSELSRRGIQCDLLVATDKGPQLDASPVGVNVIRLHKRNCRRAIPALARYMHTARPDVVLSTVLSANVAAIIASRLLSNPPRLVIREASRTDEQINSQRRMQRFIDFHVRKFTYPMADFVVAVSRDVQSALISAKLTSNERSRVIYNPLTRPVTATKEPTAAASTPSLILACGRLEKEKDYPTLLRALKIVLGKRDVGLTILGEGSLSTHLKLMASELGIREHVSFEGFVEDTQPYLERASVFVHTSRFEGFPSAILEAAAAGCPIVATDSPGGAREILRAGELGTLVPVGDAQAVAAAILEILNGEIVFSPPHDYGKRFSLSDIATEYLDALFPDQHTPPPSDD